MTADESDLERFKGWLPQDTVLLFTEEQVGLYFRHMSEQGLKMSTLHRKRACFSEFGKWGRRKKIWVENPVDGVQPIRRPEFLPRPFSHERDRLLALELPPTRTCWARCCSTPGFA